MTDIPICFGICERSIRAVPGTVGVVLCPDCAAHPVLVAAFKEGRARLVEKAT